MYSSHAQTILSQITILQSLLAVPLAEADDQPPLVREMDLIPVMALVSVPMRKYKAWELYEWCF
jgi:hypothetical protein